MELCFINFGQSLKLKKLYKYLNDIELAYRKAGITRLSNTGMIIMSRFSLFGSGQAIPTFGTGQVVTFNRKK